MKGSKLAIFLAVALILSISLTVSGRAETRQLKINTISATGSIWHKAMIKFSELVKIKTNGQIEVLVYADGQLGNIPQTLSGMQLGSIDMGYFGTGSSLYLKEAKPLHIMYVPYLFKSKQEALRILNQKIFTDIYENLAKKIAGEIKKQIMVSGTIELVDYGSLPRSERKSKRVFDNRED